MALMDRDELAPPAPAARPSTAAEAALEADIRAIGRRLARPQGSPAVRAARAAQDRGMALTARDPQVMAALFRLVDVHPACSGPRDVADHLGALLGEVDAPAVPVRLAARAADSRAARWLTGRSAGLVIDGMARRFIAGADPQDATREFTKLWSRGVATSVDLLGEATVTREEGAAYAARCASAIDVLSGAAARWPRQEHLEADAAGPIARANLSVKVTALTPLVRAHAPERGREDAAPLLRDLLRRARDRGAHLHIDMESLDAREMVLDLVLELLAEPEFAEGPSAGIVLQAYLRDSEETLDRVLAWAERTPRAQPLTVRLVKGAYWDHELVEAVQAGWPVPVWTERADSDRCFERCTTKLLEAFPTVRAAIASHNLRSVAHAIARARQLGLDPHDVELQVLRGLGDELQDSLAGEGLRVRTYSPVGDMVEGMAYLVRRLLENTSNDSFLASRSAGADLDDLLRAP